MIFSTQKPKRIVILGTQDDIRTDTCKVQYAFRFAIQQATQIVPDVDEQGNLIEKEVKGWQYEEIVDEITIPLYLKTILPDLLRTMYSKLSQLIEQNIMFAKQGIPKEIE